MSRPSGLTGRPPRNSCKKSTRPWAPRLPPPRKHRRRWPRRHGSWRPQRVVASPGSLSPRWWPGVLEDIWERVCIWDRWQIVLSQPHPRVLRPRLRLVSYRSQSTSPLRPRRLQPSLRLRYRVSKWLTANRLHLCPPRTTSRLARTRSERTPKSSSSGCSRMVSKPRSCAPQGSTSSSSARCQASKMPVGWSKDSSCTSTTPSSFVSHQPDTDSSPGSRQKRETSVFPTPYGAFD